VANGSLNSMRWIWWLRKIQAFWVRTVVVPAEPLAELGLSPGAAVCYVLASRALSDLLVLDEVCRRHKLPLPHHKKSALHLSGAASYLWLQKLGWWQRNRPDKATSSVLAELLVQSAANPKLDVQIVPVSVFWGRNPGREKASILKLLFFDDEHAGILQKFFIVLAHGRSNYLYFGKPISVRELVREGNAADQTAKKLRRVLRVHFRRQSNIALGPSLPSRSAVAAGLMQSRAIRLAIVEESQKKNLPVEKIEVQARRYIIEIASEQKYSVVQLGDMFLSWLWNRVFRGVVIKHAHRLREIDHDHEVVYLPSHRSHMDYLLLGHSLYNEGFFPPHTAAGINLDFWPVGLMLRGLGGFYVRRSFQGNRLYTVVFNEYVHYLLTKGYPVEFYTEGGRSRTGRLLEAKTGMLSMVVHSYLRNSERPIAIVPIYIGYDKVVEVRTYQTELRGKSKATESVAQLVRARRILKTNFGKAYIGIGEPIYLSAFLDAHHPGWKDEVHAPERKPQWMAPVVSTLGSQVLTRVNSTAVVTPLALFALVILSTPTKALAEDDLLYFMERLVSAMRAAPYSKDVTLPEGSPRDYLREALAVAKVERFQHVGGDVLFVAEREANHLTYYRNNIMHLFVMPALIAGFFQHNDQMAEAQLVRAAEGFYPMLKAEFYLRWETESCARTIAAVVQAFVVEGLLLRLDSGDLRRPDVTSRELPTLLILGRVLGHMLERYAITNTLMAASLVLETVDRLEFEQQCTDMARRIALLGGVSEPEFLDKLLMKNYLDRLIALGYCSASDDGQLHPSSRIMALAADSQILLSADIQDSLRRIGGLIQKD